MLRDWLLDHGVDPPAAPASPADWAAWWDAHAGRWSADVRCGVWAGLDKVPFYRVVEKPRRAVVFAVVEAHWEYNDIGFDPAGDEGGTTVALFRSRERAEAERDRRNADRQQSRFPGRWPDEPSGMGRRPAAGDPFAPPSRPAGHYRVSEVRADEVAFFEVVEVEWDGP